MSARVSYILNMAGSELPIKKFKTAKQFESWLAKHYAKSPGVWLQFFKKASGIKGITYGEALDVALSYGWIDSLVNKYDEKSYIQKFTPRGKRSVWSKVNREHVARLIKEKRMTKHGLEAVEAAKKDGRWAQAYDSPRSMDIPADFKQQLRRNKKALAFFATLNKANQYAIAWRLQTAKKPETRTKRMRSIIETLGQGQKFH
jgi:uncharacterized protein YdeI (YjbR/CyaY-like superfamily)